MLPLWKWPKPVLNTSHAEMFWLKVNMDLHFIPDPDTNTCACMAKIVPADATATSAIHGLSQYQDHLFRYTGSHCNDKTIVSPFYPYSIVEFLYWDGFLGVCCHTGYPCKTHLKSHEISFAHNIHLRSQIVLKNCTEYGSETIHALCKKITI